MTESGWDPQVERLLAGPPLGRPGDYVPALPVTYGSFLDPLEMRLLDARDGGRETWVLLRPFRYESAVLGDTVTVPAGFIHDCESTPLVLRSFSGEPSSKAGVVHDWGVASHEPDNEELWARVYRECLLSDGIHVVTADKRYQAVAYYGHKAWVTGPKRRRVIPIL